MNCFTEEQLNRISHLIKEIEKLTDVEKLFLYLQLPCGRAEKSDAKARFNGSRTSDLFSKKTDQETTQTYTWILSHLEVDPSVSLPKQEVYDEYKAYCQANGFEPLCVADFGKAMKHAFPCIKPRRLGQRGNSRYCYSGLRKKYKIQPPNLPDMIEPTFCLDNDCSQTYRQIIKDCRDNPDECPLNNRPEFTGNEVMNLKIDPGNHQQQQQQQHQQHPHQPQHQQPHQLQPHHHQQQHPHQSPHQQQQPHQYSHSNGNGATNYAGTNGESFASIRQRLPIHDPNHSQLASGVAVHLTPVSTHDYVPSNPVPIVSSQASPARYSYAVIQQPGTPDDDDYRHNYQDVFPINSRHSSMFSTTTGGTNTEKPVPPTNQAAAAAAAAATATNGFMYLHQQQLANSKGPQMQCLNSSSNNNNRGLMTTSTATATAAATAVNNGTTGNNGANNLSGTQFQIQDTTAPTTSHHVHQQLYRMDSSHIDSCASPFQSPASTPYPMMGGHLNQEMSDYYSNDCVRYP